MGVYFERWIEFFHFIIQHVHIRYKVYEVLPGVMGNPSLVLSQNKLLNPKSEGAGASQFIVRGHVE